MLYTGIWRYARFPEHYAGEAEAATAELGKLIFENSTNALAETIKYVKKDAKTPAVQWEFFEAVDDLDERDK